MATKVAAILTSLTSLTSAEEQSLTEVARVADPAVSTAHRLMAELAAVQLLERDGGRFRAGLSVRRISARAAGGTSTIEDCAAPVLHDLAAATGFRIRLGVLAWPNVTYPTAVDVLHGVSRVDRSALPINDLRRSLAVVRRRRMAINPGGCCFAKPVFGPGGHVVAALGMTVTDLDAALRPLIGVLTIAARSLSGGSGRSVHFTVAGDASPGDSPATVPSSDRHLVREHNESRAAPVRLAG
jgi:DNA-binding IclR family transcriptional regulator